MTRSYDIAVIGSGFAGSLMAMIAHRLGLRAILLERGTHPRMAIGESSTPLSNLLLEELAIKYDLPFLKPLCKWGSWRKAHPELVCGLKRGFTFFHHTPGAAAASINARENQLFVAASPHNEIGDTHWFRADFDHFLVRQAQQLGVEYLDEVVITEFHDQGQSIRLRGMRKNRELEFTAKFVVDATGPRGYLYHALGIGELPLLSLPPTQAIFSHFSGVSPTRFVSGHGSSRAEKGQEMKGALAPEESPYPIDDAAVHHIFNGGWIWVLRFSNGVTSAGLTATDSWMSTLEASDPELAWKRVLHRFPALQEQFADAQPVQPFRYIPRLGFRSAAITGHNWAMLPSAAGFVDPLLSTGFPLALLGIARLAQILEHDWGTPKFTARLADYAAHSDAELLATTRLIAALYASMDNFPAFSALTLLYFATASYSETARRLGKPHLASSFLLYDHPSFGPQSARLLERATRGMNPKDVIREVRRVIEPFDVAGLCRQDRRNWYPVDADDLLGSAHKLGTTREEVTRMLELCGSLPATLPA